MEYFKRTTVPVSKAPINTAETVHKLTHNIHTAAEAALIALYHFGEGGHKSILS